MNIFDANSSRPSLLATAGKGRQDKPEWPSVDIYIGDPDCREYDQRSSDGQSAIFLPLPYQWRRHAAIAAADLQKYALLIADLLIRRLPAWAGGIAHFDNLVWGPLAHRLKSALNMTIVCEYDGIIGPGSNIPASMLSVADRIICSSRVAMGHLLSLHPALADRSLVVYNPPPFPEKAATGTRSSWGLAKDDYLVVFNKKLVPPRYEMGPALDIFQNYTPPSARLFVLNETEAGDYTSFVKKSAWPRINLIGAITDEDAMDLYSIADKVIIPVPTEDNFLRILSLRQQQIPFVFDHDAGENPWLEESMQTDPELFSRTTAAERLSAVYRQAATTSIH